MSPSAASLVVVSPESTWSRLRELEREAHEAHEAYEQLKKAAKDAKDLYDAKVEQILKVLRETSNPLPLFEAADRQKQEAH